MVTQRASYTIKASNFESITKLYVYKCMIGKQFWRLIQIKHELKRFYRTTQLVSVISCSYSPTLPSSGKFLHSVFLYCGQFQSVSQCMHCCCWFSEYLLLLLLLFLWQAHAIPADDAACWCYYCYGKLLILLLLLLLLLLWRRASSQGRVYLSRALLLPSLSNLGWRGGALSLL